MGLKKLKAQRVRAVRTLRASMLRIVQLKARKSIAGVPPVELIEQKAKSPSGSAVALSR